jgi:hypothetical protein
MRLKKSLASSPFLTPTLTNPPEMSSVQCYNVGRKGHPIKVTFNSLCLLRKLEPQCDPTFKVGVE